MSTTPPPPHPPTTPQQFAVMQSSGPQRPRAAERPLWLTLTLGAVAIIAVIGVAAAAFVVGRVTGDPTTSDAYTRQTSKLTAAESDRDDARAQNETLTSDVSDARAQVDALTSELPAAEVGDGPALSEGVAIAPRNIRLKVNVRSKQCFGSAGCNVTVQISPQYVGTQDASSGSWEITYEIRGGEDGTIVETMTLEDGTFTFPEEQSLSTRSSATKLTAVATSVSAAD